MTKTAIVNKVIIKPGEFEQAFNTALVRAREERFTERLREKDATVFGKSGAALDSINSRLGWITSSSEMKPRLEDIKHFADSVISEGVKHLIVLGMGGSSLAPELFGRMFGHREGLDSLEMLDSTDPEAITNLLARIDLKKSLFIVSSKSGKTIETLSHADFFYEKIRASGASNPGSHFAAVTDEGSNLETLALKKSFRRVFLNPADIGGRYSVLSYFGLVPAAFTRVDLDKLIEHAVQAEKNCFSEDYDINFAIRIGTLWAVAAERGVDKLTIVATESLIPFVPWVEQLIAESTGKEGKGVVPLESEPIGDFLDYGEDRLFMFLKHKNDSQSALSTLEQDALAGECSVISITLDSKEEIGYEFIRQEMATAIAGFVMGINPFDEPNVQESKDNTAGILQEFNDTGFFPHPKVITGWAELEIADMGEATDYSESELDSPSKTLKRFFTSLRRGSYVSILNYFETTDGTEQALEQIRKTIRAKFGVATLRGYGPRFLHSIGQLYKGGAALGLFIVITHEKHEKLEIPGQQFSFNQLISAQAIGDTRALMKRNLPTLMINCPTSPAEGLAHLAEEIDGAFKDLRGAETESHDQIQNQTSSKVS